METEMTNEQYQPIGNIRFNDDAIRAAIVDANMIYPTEAPIFCHVDDVLGKLREFRKMRSITLRKVEDATGVSNAYLSQLETGKIVNPSFSTIVTLLRYYDVKVII